jgi:hypothetical protein
MPFKLGGVTHGETGFGEVGPHTHTAQSKPKSLFTVSVYNH